MPDIFRKERIIAEAGYTRWHAMAAAFILNLCIGQLYALTVFQEPLSRLLDGSATLFLKGASSDIVINMFTIAVFMLGATTLAVSRKVESAGPRILMFASTCCFSSGLWIASVGIHFHEVSLLYLGYGCLGGIGIGLGYISPLATLMRWFPARIGFATGVSLTGFGAGAMIAIQLSRGLMDLFGSDSTFGVSETFLALGVIYFLVMGIATFTIRVPASAIQGAGESSVSSPDNQYITLESASKSRQFYLIWIIGFVNTTAGIGILGRSPSILKELFHREYSSIEIAGFIGFLSLNSPGF